VKWFILGYNFNPIRIGMGGGETPSIRQPRKQPSIKRWSGSAVV